MALVGKQVKRKDHELSFVFINKIPKLVNMKEMNNFKPDISVSQQLSIMGSYKIWFTNLSAA